uniref:Uncharacterized protein n=1 Tax=Panagrellus redivivus TaxID=6233 RepID=A0A7E4VA54_PANRE
MTIFPQVDESDLADVVAFVASKTDNCVHSRPSASLTQRHLSLCQLASWGQVIIFNWTGKAKDDVLHDSPLQASFLALARCIVARIETCQNDDGSHTISPCVFNCLLTIYLVETLVW